MMREAMEAVANGGWQGLALTAGLAVVLKLWPRASASFRYFAWFAGLLAVAALPVWPLWPRAAVTVSPEMAAMLAEAPVTRGFHVPASEGVVELIFGVWVLGSGVLLARLGADCWKLERLRRRATAPSGMMAAWAESWEAEFRVSADIALPAAAGLGRPAVLFPVGFEKQVAKEEARQVWLHEVAHLRRGDGWTLLVQRVIESVFFFHPGVRWIARQMNLEREIACDDFVSERAGGGKPYAACLARLAEAAEGHPHPAAAPGAAASGRQQIMRRVEMLLNRNRNNRAQLPLSSALLVAMAVLAGASLLGNLEPLFALEDEVAQEAPPAPPAPPASPAPPARPARPTPRPSPAPLAIVDSEEIRQGVEEGIAKFQERHEAELAEQMKILEKRLAELQAHGSALGADQQRRLQSEVERHAKDVDRHVRQLQKELERQLREFKLDAPPPPPSAPRAAPAAPPPPPPPPAPWPVV